MSEINGLINLAGFDGRKEPDYLSWKETHRIGCAEYIPERNYIYLYVYNNEDTPYAVNLNIDSLEKWLEHISHKTWATSEVLGDFVRCYFWIDKEQIIELTN